MRISISHDQKSALDRHFEQYGRCKKYCAQFPIADVEMLAENIGLPIKSCLTYFYQEEKNNNKSNQLSKLKNIFFIILILFSFKF